MTESAPRRTAEGDAAGESSEATQNRRAAIAPPPSPAAATANATATAAETATETASEATPWLALCAAVAAGSVVAWWVPSAWLDWQPARAAAEPWRLVTAAWVHWSPAHLAANLAATGVVAALGWAARLPSRAAAAWALAWPLGHAGLWSQSALAHYGGASGVLHAAVAVAACWLLVGREQRGRWVGAGIGLGLLAKVLLEEPWAGPAAAARTWDIAVAPAAHASGALAGAVMAIALLAWRRRN